MSLPGSASPIRYAQTIDLPYSQGQMFDLVADIERYPEFLDEYREAKIHARNGNVLLVDQVIGLPLVNVSLRAEATFKRPESIVVRSSQSLLGELDIHWAFEAMQAGSRVRFRIELLPVSRFATGLAEFFVAHSAARTLDAFASRAARLYARP